MVRDDLFPGGTKARFLGVLFNGTEEVVYASPAEGAAQVALATVARRLNNFVAREQSRIRAQSKLQTLVPRS